MGVAAFGVAPDRREARPEGVTIKHVAGKRFRGLRDAGVEFGDLTLLIGPNGGGKSNLLDTIRFLQGAGNGFSIAEILDGRPEGAAHRKWDGIRGKASESLWQGALPADGTPLVPSLPREAFAIYAGTSSHAGPSARTKRGRPLSGRSTGAPPQFRAASPAPRSSGGRRR